jgi:hypothetical protein
MEPSDFGLNTTVDSIQLPCRLLCTVSGTLDLQLSCSPGSGSWSLEVPWLFCSCGSVVESRRISSTGTTEQPLLVNQPDEGLIY